MRAPHLHALAPPPTGPAGRGRSRARPCPPAMPDGRPWSRISVVTPSFFMVGARFEYTHIPFGMFRLHDAQKTGDGWKQTQSLLSAATQLVTTAETFTEEARRRIIEELRAYERDYWARTGLLARIGLPPSIVLPLRGLRAGLRGSAARLVRRHGNERAACRSTSGP
jgi:hypothetical protein